MKMKNVPSPILYVLLHAIIALLFWSTVVTTLQDSPDEERATAPLEYGAETSLFRGAAVNSSSLSVVPPAPASSSSMDVAMDAAEKPSLLKFLSRDFKCEADKDCNVCVCDGDCIPRHNKACAAGLRHACNSGECAPKKEAAATGGGCAALDYRRPRPSPPRTATTDTGAFMNGEFRAYKAAVDQQMEVYRRESAPDAATRPECQPVFYGGEFGMELRVMVPWAYYIREVCGGVAIEGILGTKYLYFFSNKHSVRKREGKFVSRKGNPFLPKGNPFKSEMVHIRDERIPRDPKWRPPPYADFFGRPRELTGILRDKPLVVILNKYVKQYYVQKNPWYKGKGTMENHFSVRTLREMLDYLTPKYTVLYKRTTPKALMDFRETKTKDDLNEMAMIRDEFPEVLIYGDFEAQLDDPEDANLLLFGFMAMSRRFLTVQGGNAVVGSYFGGINIILIKEGKEKIFGDYGYFYRFSNATVIETRKDEAFLTQMKCNM